MDDDRINRARDFARVWYAARTDAGYSQEAVALALGVSKKTVQNWERGISSPSLFQGEEFFRVLGLNPMKYYLAYKHPILFPAGNTSDAVVEAIYAEILKAPPRDREQILYVMARRRENVWPAMLQLIIMHSNLSLEARAASAQLVIDLFKMERASGRIICPDDIAPDLDVAQAAIDTAKVAASLGKKSIYD